MVTVSTQDVAHLARLSALALSSEETDALRADIANILSYIEQLGDLDTEGVAPTYQVTGLRNVWRDDSVHESLVDGQALVALSPEYQKNQIKVPKVLE